MGGRGRARGVEWGADAGTPGGLGELDLIERIRGEFAGVGGRGAGGGRALALGIGDDCAILRPPVGAEVLVTTDMTIERRHFRRDLHPAESVGHRCLARGLSDLAAMGGRPMAAFLSLALPPEMLAGRRGRSWVGRFFAGMRALANGVGVPLAGGDTAEATGGLLMADIVLLGTAPAGRSLRRAGAKAGDRVYVTGTLGGAAAELQAMLGRGERDMDARAVRGWDGMVVQERHPQMFPQPRLRVGAELLRRGVATACMDLSDGLSTDLRHLLRASGKRMGAEVWLGELPLGRGADDDLALHGGEDYELLFTASPGARVPGQIGGVRLTEIGRVVHWRAGEPRIVGVRDDGAKVEIRRGGWEHFAGATGRTA